MVKNSKKQSCLPFYSLSDVDTGDAFSEEGKNSNLVFFELEDGRRASLHQTEGLKVTRTVKKWFYKAVNQSMYSRLKNRSKKYKFSVLENVKN